MRRVVVGMNDKGRSYVVSDDDVDGVLWETDLGADHATIDAAECAVALEPPAGTSRFVTTTILPVSDQNQGEMPPGVDKDGFHTTRTVDYVYLVDGSLNLDLDEQSVEIRAGDCVVQMAARHAWRNTGDRPVRLAAVMTSLT